MKLQFALIYFVLASLSLSRLQAETIFRRKNKISEQFKKLTLPADEIDPNVAPLQPPKIEDVIPGINIAYPANDEESTMTTDELNANAETTSHSSISNHNMNNPVESLVPESSTIKPVKDADIISKYCKCSESFCNCCRNFGLPFGLLIRGPGCAKITYLGNEKMSVSIKYADITLATRTISGKNAKPICVGLPGGFSRFCGRIYGLSKAKENFKACLGFELHAEDEIEATLRVSCFKFGPEGLKVAEAEPFPNTIVKDQNDDDDDDFFGADEDDEDDEEDDTEDNDEYGVDDEAEVTEEVDYGGFSLGSFLSDLEHEENKSKIGGKLSPQSKKTSVTQKESAESKNTDWEMTSSIIKAVNKIAKKDNTSTKTILAASNKKIQKEKDRKKKQQQNKFGDTEYAFKIMNDILDLFN